MTMRIDCHAHGDPDFLKGEPEAYVDRMREKGIEAIVLIQKMEILGKAMERFGDFVIPVAWINMNTADPDEIESCVRAGCKGIKFIQPHAPYADKRYWPLYDKVEELGVVAVFHTGFLMMFEEREEKPILMEHMRAAQVEAVSRRNPNLKILMAHFSNPWWEEAWKVATSKKNIHADLSGGTAIHRSIRMWAEMFAPDGRLLEHSVRKLVFASDSSYFNEEREGVGRYMEFYDRLFDALGLSPELREHVNRGAARALFGLDEADETSAAAG